jgi:2-dehydro-3-deoxy-L-fuconate 4-dehydrogenase
MTAGTRLAHKNCVITAAAAGIGRATARAYAREGARVLAADIDAAALASLSREDQSIRTAVVDVTDARQIAALAASEPETDVLFNCAGYVHAGSILETTLADWQRSFAINVDSMFHLCKAVLPGMLRRGRGSIINMSSVASSVKGVANRCAYGASKAAVIGLTRSIAADYVTQGIRCNAICPGTVRTPSLAARVAALGGDPEAAWKSFIARQPMGRLGEPEEIAALAVYLASDESAFVTGTIHIVDGGWSN